MSSDRDRRTEGRRPRTSRGGCDESRAQLEELVRLNDDRITGASLLTPTSIARRRQSKDLASNHLNRRRGAPTRPAVPARSASPPDLPRRLRGAAPRHVTPSVPADAQPPPGAPSARRLSRSSHPHAQSRERPPKHRRDERARSAACAPRSTNRATDHCSDGTPSHSGFEVGEARFGPRRPRLRSANKRRRGGHSQRPLSSSMCRRPASGAAYAIARGLALHSAAESWPVVAHGGKGVDRQGVESIVERRAGSSPVCRRPGTARKRAAAATPRAAAQRRRPRCCVPRRARRRRP